MNEIACSTNLPVTEWVAINSSDEGRVLEQRRAMERFLSGVERRALRMAQFAVRHPEDAMDIVQDAMLNLAHHYASVAPQEWQTLFFRILRNRILDHHRRRSVRNRVMAYFTASADDAAEDVLEQFPAPAGAGPEHQTVVADAMTALERAVGALPGRQQQAFLLRNLEGLDVAATAAVMGCSVGSVKTHYSRAVHALRAALGDHWS